MKRLFIAGIIMLLVAPLTFIAAEYAIPFIIPYELEFNAHILSIDNIYSAEKGRFLGAQLSKTQNYAEVIGHKDGIALVHCTFDVQTLSGEKIAHFERLNGIDPRTGKHVPGYGEQDRDGYMWGPRNLKKGEPFTRWHVNYNAPANLKYVGTEKIEGLKTYMYEADYNADQTENLGHLPDVPEKYGINVDVNLKVWVEPVTGRMIKYEDHSNAYFYDVKTTARIHEWNRFNNRLTLPSIQKNVADARTEKLQILLLQWVIPLAIGLGGLVLLILSFRKVSGQKRNRKHNKHR